MAVWTDDIGGMTIKLGFAAGLLNIASLALDAPQWRKS